jgi:hypothetical protein
MKILRDIRNTTPRQASFLFACALLACGLWGIVAGATLILLWDWVAV